MAHIFAAVAHFDPRQPVVRHGILYHGEETSNVDWVVAEPGCDFGPDALFQVPLRARYVLLLEAYSAGDPHADLQEQYGDSLVSFSGGTCRYPTSTWKYASR